MLVICVLTCSQLGIFSCFFFFSVVLFCFSFFFFFLIQAPSNSLARELPFIAGRVEGIRPVEPSSPRILSASQVLGPSVHVTACFCQDTPCFCSILSLKLVVSQQHAERLCDENSQPGKQEGPEGPAGLCVRSSGDVPVPGVASTFRGRACGSATLGRIVLRFAFVLTAGFCCYCLQRAPQTRARVACLRSRVRPEQSTVG